jgi:antitoxin (DNA-binding transcriptional repressor) of toxin-antitoxin stability system
MVDVPLALMYPVCSQMLMEEMAISKFKATCLAVLERVRKTGKPIRVTRFGQVVAEIVPPGGGRPAPRLGTGLGTGAILGDIVGPAGEESDWEAGQYPPEDQDTKKPR